ncbi:histidine kinase-, DNA gyrase b-, and HSP90-like ATPase domain-containing protein [Hirsutella rhossiliensis]|uniref:DNA mismatch repair protein PMS1 n=1 Tax=Hirsutella rhossiliensis TaxID=111463 RepID=A0A9P8N075_9HYPO|nr:histidine kinase-, DNA gyrase b-, and HSP90-like ATPase domain-containing protein [Hirsutella rhossiliensis]KAH0964455.1 histidine kinase-, DNA gyrase b-, and HSP90-like ATPase domain-containing protein [Hirsutella rhossiliensis]
MAANIRPIDGKSVHQIQSGQVIVDLCSVVKELAENSIDAGATNIDVRFKNQGLDLIEVQDNGSGISPANYPFVALKHHTSKLSSFADIASLQTFGFRGEALSSLCALSNLTVTTCVQADVPKGSRLSFEPSGQLRNIVIAATQRGTIVSIEGLFHNLPVRRRELERNIKREWQKVVALLSQYACIQTNVKLSVSQQPTKGKRVALFSTRGNPTTRENIINIFGAKTMSALVSLDLDLEIQPTTTTVNPEATAGPGTDSNKVRVVGHISRPSPGDGRQTPDRQMFFVNGRPCGLPQFAKTFNEVYRSFNHSQSPFIFADVRLDTQMYDVNVSPDKRSILLHDQGRLLDTLRASLATMFDSHDCAVPIAQPGGNNRGPNPHDGAARPVIASFANPKLRPGKTQEGKVRPSDDAGAGLLDDSDSDSGTKSSRQDAAADLNRLRSGSRPSSRRGSDANTPTQPVSNAPGASLPVRDFNSRLADNTATALAATKRTTDDTASSVHGLADDNDDLGEESDPAESSLRRGNTPWQAVQRLLVDEEDIRSRMDYLESHRWTGDSAAPATDQVEDIGASDAESKLTLTISRSDFTAMRIVGQFNMGFIIAHDELFIIDQHASDEKYNFERLQSTTIVQSQRLVHPKKLQLTALEEEIVMGNLTAIEANGFKVTVDASCSSPVGLRCEVVALPLSRETTFNLDDLEELIALLGDEAAESDHVPRPSKVRKMFAMRACRSSVMIGKALTFNQMYGLVRQMGELDKPWNCPHGRPTMRHLCRLQAWDEKCWGGDSAACSAASWRSYARGD